MVGVLVFVGVVGIGALVAFLYLRGMSRMRHSMDSLYRGPEDMRRAGDGPPPEVDTGWMNNLP
jgi:hypothetical protein